MPRVDVWDIPEDKPLEPIWIGYKRGLTDKYDFGRQLGEGGFGSVRVVVQKSNGAEFACKSICKRLDVPNLPPIKQQQHLENIKREVLILRKLRGTLNVVHLSAAYEDDSHVHIIMEYCRGGELFHKMGRRHYSEQTVASYMRAVLRTLAQCHAHRILHRDIKPGNFMLLTDAQDAPLKAIDFGLAVFFDPAQLPRTDLGLEGTPWYMAPEVLSSSVEPASDVWAAGVMAYQLLSGRFPFDDWAHPEAPALSLVWRSILSESPSFKGSCWKEVSEPAKDFCRTLLNKDPATRPTAREALAHSWLQKGTTRQRMQGAQLTQVVQRLQRHSQQNVFKKTVLDMMANELLARHMARTHNAEQQQQQQQVQQVTLPGQQQQQQPSAVGSPPPPAGGGAGGCVRPLTGLLGAVGSSVTPQYAEGSLHRQQQLLRLIPPAKRTSSSLELSSHEVGSLAQHGTAHAHLDQQPGQHDAGPGLRPGVLRLEGTWHGPRAGLLQTQALLPGGGWGADAGVVSAGGGQPPCEGGTYMRGVGSLRGATSALEALRRARERAAAAAAAAAASAGGILGGTGQGVHPAPDASSGPTAAAAAAAGPDGVSAVGSTYKGPVKDSDTASLWDMQFMANRLAMEGSAHGNAYTQRLLKAASTHAGKTPAAAVIAAQQQQTQQQQSDTTPHQRTPTLAMPQLLLPPQQQQQQQQQPSPQQWQGHAQLQAASAAVATRAAAGRMEGTWHGPPRSTSISIAEAARQSHGAPEVPDLSRDLSWHGVTSHMRHLSEAEVASGSARAVQRQEFLRFLEGARRQRLEQRKVARLVLEGSMHGGVQYFLPARGTSSVAVPAGAAAAPASGPGSLMECDDDEASEGGAQSEEGALSEEQQEDTGALRGAPNLTGYSAQASPGSSGRGGSAAAAAATAAVTAAGLPPGVSPKPSQASTGLLGKLKRSFKHIITPHTAAAAGRVRGQGTPSARSSGSGSCSDLNTLARQSWRPDAAAAGEAAGVWGAPATAPDLKQQGLPGQAAASSVAAAQGGTPKAATAAGVLPALGPSEGSGGGRGGVGPQAQLAENILELQSPGWQASLETRRRGQGAYAALMAATNMASELGAGQPHAPQPDSTAAAAGGATLLLADTGDTAQQRPPAAAAAPGTGVPAAADDADAPGTTAANAAGPSHWSLLPVLQPVAVEDSPRCSIGLTPLEQALQGPAPQPRQQQEQGVNSMPLEQAAIDKQQQQQQSQQGMLPMPVAKQQQQQQQQQQAPVGHHLLPQPGSHRPAAAAGAAVPSSSPGLVQPGRSQHTAAGPDTGSSLLPVPGGTRQHTGHTAAAAAPPGSAHVRVGHAGYAPFWTFGAGGAVGGDPSMLPRPGGGWPSSQHTGVEPAVACAAGDSGSSTAAAGGAAGGAASGAAGGAALVSQPPTTPMQEAAGAPLPKPLNGATAAAAAAAAGAAGGGAGTADAAAVTSSVRANNSADFPVAVGALSKTGAGPAATTAAAAAVAPPIAAVAAATSGSVVVQSVGGVHMLPELAEVQQLLDLLADSSSDLITVEQLQQGLVSLGYSLEPSEVLELAQNLGYGVAGTEGVALSQFAASQLDWENIQANHRDEWLQCLRSTFDAMDVDKDGRLKPSEILEALKDKLPQAEVNAAIEDVLLEAAADEDEGLDFAAFKMLASIAGDAATALDQFDARLRTSYDAGGSVHSQTDTLQLLQSVSEATGS